MIKNYIKIAIKAYNKEYIGTQRCTREVCNKSIQYVKYSVQHYQFLMPVQHLPNIGQNLPVWFLIQHMIRYS